MKKFAVSFCTKTIVGNYDTKFVYAENKKAAIKAAKSLGINTKPLQPNFLNGHCRWEVKEVK